MTSVTSLAHFSLGNFVGFFSDYIHTARNDALLHSILPCSNFYECVYIDIYLPYIFHKRGDKPRDPGTTMLQHVVRCSHTMPYKTWGPTKFVPIGLAMFSASASAKNQNPRVRRRPQMRELNSLSASLRTSHG